MTGLVLTFPNNDTLNVDYITSSLVINENYFKSLKSVDNNCKLKVIFSINLSNKLKQFADDDIIANVYNADEDLIFSGFLRKTFTFNKTQINQPIDIEIVSPTYLLNKELKTDVFKTSETVGSIVNALGSQLGYTLNCTISDTVDYFRAVKGDNVKDIIEQLLFEYEYTFDFDVDGSFVTYPLFNTPTAENISHAFTGSDCLEKIQIKRTEKQYTGVTAKWQKKEYVTEALLYEDTQGATTSAACSIDVAPRSYMYGDNNDNGRNYLQFDSTKGSVLYASNIWLVANGTYIEMLETSYENCGDSVLWSCFNPHMTITATYHKFQWWGRAWVATSENESKTTVTGDKSLELNLSYLNDGNDISTFIAKVADYYRFSLFNVLIKSKEDVAVGSFVTVQDYGTGKITGRVISKQTNYTGVYTYTIESISEYTPAELDEEKNSIYRKPSDGYTDNIATLKGITDSLQQQIDGIEQTGTTCALDLSAVTLEIDDEGFTQTVQTFSIFVTLKRSEEDLDFIIGNTDNPFIVPQGWTYVVDGKKITFTVGEGVQVTAGNIKIPVIYTPVLSDLPFVDENDNYFIDENGDIFRDVILGEGGTVWNLYLSYIGNGYGKFLGTFKTISEINACNPNVSDYFVWGGTDKVSTTLAYEGFLRQAQTYKYIGTGKPWSWQEDTNSGHMQAALSDVLAISNADLEKNNSTVWMYLDHLTSNSVYCDKLVANDAFIEKLSAKIITADLVTTDGLATTLQSYETIANLTETLKLYEKADELAETLKSYTTNSSLATTLEDYATTQSVSDTYETKTNASSTYETKTNAGNTYETKTHASSTYETQSDFANKIKNYPTNTELKNALNAYVKSTSLFGTDGHVLSAFASDSIANAIVNGKTVISGGFINTNCLNSDVVTTSYLEANYASIDYLEGGNADFKGKVEAQGFSLKVDAGDIIVGGSYFNADSNVTAVLPCHGKINLRIYFGAGYIITLKLNDTVIVSENDIKITPTYIVDNVYTFTLTIKEGDKIKLTSSAMRVISPISYSVKLCCSISNPLLDYLIKWE